MKNVSNCQVEQVLKVIGGKWKLIILWHLAHSTLRFSEIEKKVPGVTQKMLTQSLRDLERDGLVSRKVYPVVPPKVEYAMTPKGVSLGKAIRELEKWGKEYLPASDL